MKIYSKSSVKGRWGEVEKQHQKAEEERAKVILK
jgi:hypothetical protein